MNPLISIIVPVCNGQDYLEKCIDNIVKQTYPNLEIIIVNNGSTDRTADICDRLIAIYSTEEKQRHRIINVISITNKGVSLARNKGIEVANGEYISFVDVDDLMAFDMLQVLYDNILETESDVSGCDFFQWSSDKEIKTALEAVVNRCNDHSLYTSADFSDQIINGNSRCWSKLYKRSVIINSGVKFDENLSIGEDMLFLAELTKKDLKFCETSYKGYGYYYNSIGAMNKSFSLQAMDQIFCWEKARNFLGDNSKIDSIILISSLLTIGRIAVLDKREQSKYHNEIITIHNTFKRYYQKSVVNLLDRGYRLKAAVFNVFPRLYIIMYGIWKK